MRIEDYGPQVIISREYMESICQSLTEKNPERLWNPVLQKHMFRYGCFDQPITYPKFQGSKYFGNLGVEVRRVTYGIKWECGDYAHFNLRGVRPEDFGIYRNWAPGEFAPFMKNHPAIYKRVAIVKEKCKFVNIHIHEDINIEWGPW